MSWEGFTEKEERNVRRFAWGMAIAGAIIAIPLLIFLNKQTVEADKQRKVDLLFCLEKVSDFNWCYDKIIK